MGTVPAAVASPGGADVAQPQKMVMAQGARGRSEGHRPPGRGQNRGVGVAGPLGVGLSPGGAGSGPFRRLPASRGGGGGGRAARWSWLRAAIFLGGEGWERWMRERAAQPPPGMCQRRKRAAGAQPVPGPILFPGPIPVPCCPWGQSGPGAALPRGSHPRVPDDRAGAPQGDGAAGALPRAVGPRGPGLDGEAGVGGAGGRGKLRHGRAERGGLETGGVGTQPGAGGSCQKIPLLLQQEEDGERL